MVQESTTKVGSTVVALLLVGAVAIGAAPSTQAEELGLEENAQQRACITVYTSDPGVTVAPQDCELPGTSNTTEPTTVP